MHPNFRVRHLALVSGTAVLSFSSSFHKGMFLKLLLTQLYNLSCLELNEIKYMTYNRVIELQLFIVQYFFL